MFKNSKDQDLNKFIFKKTRVLGKPPHGMNLKDICLNYGTNE